MDANTRNWVIGGVVAIVVIVLGWWLLTKPSHSGSSMATSTATTTEMATTTMGSSTVSGRDVTTESSGETLSVADQKAGDTVMVTGVTTYKTSWIAVRDAMRVYGARRVEAAASGATVAVPLLRPTTASTTYQVVMYADDGDRSFDLHKDALITGVGGSFTATQ